MINKLVADDKALRRAKSLAHRLLKGRAQTEAEIVRKLKSKGFSQSVLTQVLGDLTKAGLINDREFSEFWIKQRLIAGYGFIKIIFELEQKGVARNTIEELIDQAQVKDDLSIVLGQLVRKRKEKYRTTNLEDIKAKLFSYLQARGFSRQEITECLERTE